MLDRTIRLDELAEMLGAELTGDGATEIRGLAALDDAGEGDLTFALDQARAERLGTSGASAALVAKSADVAEVALPLLRVDDVQLALASLLDRATGPEDLAPVGVHTSAVVDESASLGADVRIGPGCVVGPGATIGDRTALLAGATVGANVTIGADCLLFERAIVRRGCAVGDRVRIGPGAVVGFEGFGYHHVAGVHHRIPHAGSVILENDVDLGANCCVDRAKLPGQATRIAAGAKVDNLVQIAHNVQLGPGCVLAAQVGIAGSTKLGAYCVLGGSVGVRDNIELGNGVQVMAYAAVASSQPDGAAIGGIPAHDARAFRRELAATLKLPDLVKRVKKLEKQAPVGGNAGAGDES